MDATIKDYLTRQTETLIAAPSCCAEARAAAQAWLAALGTHAEDSETEKYLAELAEDIEPIDGLIGFAGSDAAAKHFGAKAAGDLLAHARELKASGVKYCDCPACSAAAAILKKLGRLD